MNKNYSINNSKTDWDRIDSMQDKDIDFSDIPEIKEEQLQKAQFRFNGKTIQKNKVRVNIALDANILAYYKTKAGGRGYQTLINQALKDTITQGDLEVKLRKIIREELNYKNNLR